MSLILNQDIEKNPWKNNLTEEIVQGNYYQWGKACTIDEENILLMQSPVFCKDYIVDTYYKTTHGILVDNWTQEQLHENCIYVVFPNKTVEEKTLNNIASFLNPWFASNDIQPTVIRKFTETFFNKASTKHIYCIQGDSKWTNNAFVWSIYLSIIRMCGYKTAMKSIDFTFDNTTCNEHNYYSKQPKQQKQLLETIFNNPFVYMKELPKKYSHTGYEKGMVVSHGQTGPFCMMDFCVGAISSTKYNYTEMITTNYFTKQFYEQLYGVEYKYVR